MSLNVMLQNIPSQRLELIARRNPDVGTIATETVTGMVESIITSPLVVAFAVEVLQDAAVHLL